jgi:hypothetical protein
VGLDLDLFTGLRISSLAGFAAGFLEGTETGQCNLTILFFSALVTQAMKDSKQVCASVLVISASWAIFSIISALVIKFPPFGK